ncbi:MAG: hypothetical protein LBR91_03670 [Puniceicoccales bacterium]|jgi:hypothetical protein|nr:hypothetical protein [Puniceicoccales bacterium]
MKNFGPKVAKVIARDCVVFSCVAREQIVKKRVLSVESEFGLRKFKAVSVDTKFGITFKISGIIVDAKTFRKGLCERIGKKLGSEQFSDMKAKALDKAMGKVIPKIVKFAHNS